MDHVLCLILLTGGGFFVSLYFSLLSYEVLPYRMRVGIFCYHNGACEDILKSPYARILGLPNALWGLAFYPLVFFGVMLHLSLGILWGMTLAAFLFSVYLAYILHYRLKSFCAFCTLAQLINTALFLWLTIKIFP